MTLTLSQRLMSGQMKIAMKLTLTSQNVHHVEMGVINMPLHIITYIAALLIMVISIGLMVKALTQKVGE